MYVILLLKGIKVKKNKVMQLAFLKKNNNSWRLKCPLFQQWIEQLSRRSTRNRRLKQHSKSSSLWLSWLSSILQIKRSLFDSQSGLDSWSRNMPGFCVQSPVRARTRGNPPMFLSHIFITLSLLCLPSPLSKKINK